MSVCVSKPKRHPSSSSLSERGIDFCFAEEILDGLLNATREKEKDEILCAWYIEMDGVKRILIYLKKSINTFITSPISHLRSFLLWRCFAIKSPTDPASAVSFLLLLLSLEVDSVITHYKQDHLLHHPLRNVVEGVHFTLYKKFNMTSYVAKLFVSLQ